MAIKLWFWTGGALPLLKSGQPLLGLVEHDTPWLPLMEEIGSYLVVSSITEPRSPPLTCNGRCEGDKSSQIPSSVTGTEDMLNW